MTPYERLIAAAIKAHARLKRGLDHLQLAAELQAAIEEAEADVRERMLSEPAEGSDDV